MRITRAVGLLAGGLLLAGCGNTPVAVSSTVVITSTETVTAAPTGAVSPSSRAVPSSAPSSTNVSPRTAPLGSTHTIEADGQVLKVTAYQIKSVPKPDMGAANDKALDVQVCPPVATTVSSDDHWALTDATNGRYEPDSIPFEPMKPEYPFYPEAVEAGECVRGWVMFETGGAKITGVRYVTMVSGKPQVLRWSS